MWVQIADVVGKISEQFYVLAVVAALGTAFKIVFSGVKKAPFASRKWL
jgi:hypothetical protein